MGREMSFAEMVRFRERRRTRYERRLAREVSSGNGVGDKELEGRYLKWLHEARVGSYATRFASLGQVQPATYIHPDHS